MQDKTPEQIQMAVVWEASKYLEHGFTVIVDACNLHHDDRVRWETIAHVNNVELVWIDMDTPLDECIQRDSIRENPVGKAFIEGQFLTTSSGA
jgi:predicted kinase